MRIHHLGTMKLKNYPSRSRWDVSLGSKVGIN